MILQTELNEKTSVVLRINEAIELLRPFIMQDGGNIEFVAFAAGVVSIRFQGACQLCPMSQLTLKLGIEERLKEQIPEVTQVIAVE